MEEKDLIKKLESARLPELKMEAAAQEAKKALFFAASRKHQAPRLAFITAMAGMFAVAAAVTYYVIDNMDEGSKFNRNGGVWSTYADSQEGGDSVIWPKPGSASANEFEMSQPGYGGSGYAVKITGRSGQKLGLNYNYLGFVNRFSDRSSCPTCEGTNISRYKGIMFKIKGRITSGNLFFILPYESGDCVTERLTCRSLTGYADYEREITADVTDKWQTVAIDFRSGLNQPFWTPENAKVPVEQVLRNVHLFKWQYKNGTGEEIEIWIDEVQLY